MRYFIVSDAHSYFSFMKKALEEKGFDKDKDTLVVGGDLFDRGHESLEMLGYIESLPKKVLIRGNHEFEFLNLVENINRYGMAEDHQYHNGTVQTLYHLSGDLPENIYVGRESMMEFKADLGEDSVKYHLIHAARSETVLKVVRMIKEDFVNYLELGNFLIVHAWIPTDYDGPYSIYSYGGRYGEGLYWKDKESKERYSHVPLYDVPREALIKKPMAYDPHWKKASMSRWEEASWSQPHFMADLGIFPKGKTIISGHTAARKCWEFYEGKESDDPYFGKRFIAIDAQTYVSGQVNVLVIENGKIISGSNKDEEENPS